MANQPILVPAPLPNQTLGSRSHRSTRRKLDEEYAAEVERERTEAAKRERAGKRNPSQKIDEGPNGRRVSSQRAKTAGTNRQYVNDADTAHPQIVIGAA